jgi:hypothetical protein
MADGTANIYASTSSWSGITADLGEFIGTTVPITAAALLMEGMVADLGVDHVTEAVLPAGTEGILLPTTAVADVGKAISAASAFSIGASDVKYTMRATAQDDGAYVVWEVDDEPDDAGAYAPELIVPGSAAVSSYRFLVG